MGGFFFWRITMKAMLSLISLKLLISCGSVPVRTGNDHNSFYYVQKWKRLFFPREDSFKSYP